LSNISITDIFVTIVFNKKKKINKYAKVKLVLFSLSRFIIKCRWRSYILCIYVQYV